MRLWTIQTIDAFNAFKDTGMLTANKQFISKDFLPAYNWMFEQMKKRIGLPPNNQINYPIWAWYQWNGDKARKPDLRYSAHLPKGSKGVCIEVDVPDSKVLLSDFDLFHYVLNYWYLPKSEDEDIFFDREIANSGLTIHDLQDFSKESEVINKLRNEVKESWERIFDLNWFDEYVTYPIEEKSIQATLYHIQWNQVKDYREFTAR